ncbi:MAG: hypothetical protein AAFR33_08190 [Pseudomonadota bacterium]
MKDLSSSRVLQNLMSASPLAVAAYLFAIAAVATWLSLALWANLDAGQARHMLFMDELISFDGAEAIRNADTPFHAVREAVLNDQRYGRTMFYLSFVASTVGDVFGGEQGKILATRMAFALVLCAGICLLSWTHLKTPLGRAGAIAAGLAIPFSSYYATMPKPDPLMVFFLAAYLWAWNRKGIGLGYPMIWLGLAFGAKIAAIPAVVVLIAMAFGQVYLTGQGITQTMRKDTIVGFLAGWLMSVPAIIASIPGGLRAYLDQTWLNTGHAMDMEGIGLLDWLGLLHRTAFFGPGLATALVLAAFAGIILLAIWTASGRPLSVDRLLGNARALARSDMYLPFACGLAGAAMLAAIMISTQRLWQFYLFPGTLLVTVATVAALEYVVRAKRGLSPRLRTVAAAFGVSAVLASTAAGSVHTYSDFETLASRSDTEYYRFKERAHAAITQIAEREAAASDAEPFQIVYNASLWHPSDTDAVNYIEFYTAFWHWHLELDIVGLIDADMSLENAPEAFRTLPKRVRAQDVLPLHTDIDGPCTKAPCYRQIPSGVDGLYLFRRAPEADPGARVQRPALRPATTG